MELSSWLTELVEEILLTGVHWDEAQLPSWAVYGYHDSASWPPCWMIHDMASAGSPPLQPLSFESQSTII